MSATTYINIEITYQSYKDKFYVDYIYNDKRTTLTYYSISAVIEHLTIYLFLSYKEAKNLIDEVINNS